MFFGADLNLRLKTLLLTGGALSALFLAVYFSGANWMRSSYASLETREAKINVDRVQGLIGQQLETFHRQSLDWSNWDDTYKFIGDRNKEYIDSNLATITLKVDTMLFIGENGQVVYANPNRRVAGVVPPNAEDVRHVLGFDRLNSGNRPRLDAQFGFVEVGGKPLMVTIRAVTKSNGQGHNGWIVFGLWFDEAEIGGLSTRSHMNVEFHKLDSPVLSTFVRSRLPDEKALAEPLSDNEIAAYAILPSVEGRPLRVIRATQTRAIYHQGQKNIQFLLWAVIVSGILFGLTCLGIMEFTAVGRVRNLTRQVERITDSNEHARVEIRGDDELSWLAETINSMVDRIQAHQQELNEKNLRLADTILELGEANTALENAVEGIAKVDAEGNIVGCNVAFAQVLGYRHKELAGRKIACLIGEDSQNAFNRSCENARQNGKAEVECQANKSDGSTLHAQVTIVRPSESEASGLHVFFKDITERKALETRIAHQAFHDALTNLPNRLLFMDRLGHALNRAKRQGTGVAVLFLDLDNFKTINDSLGHDTGDELLKGIADRLGLHVRPVDTIARLGGDEFTVLLEDLQNIDDAVTVAKRIVDDLRAPFELSMGEVFAGASVGVAFSANAEHNPEQLMRNADTAMYQAKHRGKLGYVVFESSMNAKVNERLELENGLRVAIERDELFLQYQAIVDLESGDITGTEALLRWNHPTRGLLMPDVFIPIAEETGMIVPVGEWVLREACQKTLEWHARFPENAPLFVSVNLSGKQLQRVDIVERIDAILRDLNFNPKYLKLEIAETVILSDLGDAVNKLSRLKDMSIELAIDDFGTGYSSISNLSAFPVDSVKIDRDYINRMGDEGEVDAIIAAIIFLSKTMRLQVTAEGLEDRRQMTYLQALGCHSAQGYYFAKPMLDRDLESLFAKGLNLSRELEAQHQKDDSEAA